MSEQYGFFFDATRCTECYGCVIACKQWNGVEAGGPAWRRIVEVWAGEFPGVTRNFVSLSCMHCGEPPCEKVCPAGAISKREDDGIVVVDQDKCIGCHYCFFACPYGVPQYGDDGTMEKCEACLEQRTESGKPACVATCPTGALHFGTMEELSEIASKSAAGKLISARAPALTITP